MTEGANIAIAESAPADATRVPHLLLIHQSFTTPRESGGTRHYELARRLVEQGKRVTVVASDLNYLSGKKVSSDGLTGEQDFDGIRVLRARAYASLHRSLLWSLASFASFTMTSFLTAMRVRDVDVAMGTLPPFFQPWSAWLVSVLRHKPFLLEVRDLWVETAIELGALKNPVAIAIARWLEKRLYRRADCIVINSPGFRDHLIAKGVEPEKISLIANGVNPEMFDPAGRGEQVRREFRLEGKFVVTYAGALGLVNGIEPLLRAADRLRDLQQIHFLLVGDGRQREHLMTEAASLALSNLTFAGPQPKERMSEFLSASDACIAILRDTPLLRTTYPNKVFDYMAAGRPMILAIDGAIRQVVEAAQAGIYVPPADHEAIAAAVRHLFNHPAEAEHMGASGRAYVVEHFDRRKQADVLVALVDSLAGRKSTR